MAYRTFGWIQNPSSFESLSLLERNCEVTQQDTPAINL